MVFNGHTILLYIYSIHAFRSKYSDKFFLLTGTVTKRGWQWSGSGGP